jgi:hypothetical protein
MLISHKKKFIFVHIKKTAGSSIASSLRKYDDRALLLRLLNAKLLAKTTFAHRRNPLPFHIPAHQIRDYLGADYNSYFSFAFVRNPFDWQVSNYFYIKQRRRHPRYKEVRNLTFSEYLEWTLHKNRIYLQSECISEPYDNAKIIVDFVGKFENIETDFNYILSRIGLGSEVALPKTNRSRRQCDYRKYYDERSIDFIRAHYATDLLNFGYDY